jgi:superfamily II DNA or RNA helicase
MPFVKMPHSVTLPPLRGDEADDHWRTWTRQPGEGGVLHVSAVAAATPEAIPANLQAAGADNLPPPYVSAAGTISSKIQLRDYQEQAIEAVDLAWRQGRKAPLIVLPTGTGKTIVSAMMMNNLFSMRGGRSLFLAHRRELLDQTSDKIRLVGGCTVGIVQGKRNQMDRDVTIGSIQTLGHKSGKRLAKLIEQGPYAMVACDEAHHAVSPQWERVIKALREAYPEILMFGMTATPGRADGVALDRVFDTVAFERNLMDMVAAGWLVPPRGFRVKIDVDLDKVASRNGDFVSSQLSKVMNTPRVNEAVVRAWQEYGHDRKTLVFAVDVEHAHALASTFRDAGYSAEAVDGKTKDKERAAILKRFRERQTKLLINCFDAETELLTKRGWVGIDNIDPLDVTAAMDPASGELRWEPIRRIVKRPRAAGERMMHIKNQRLDIRVTEGHRMVFAKSHLKKWCVSTAAELSERTSVTRLPMAAHGSFPGADLSSAECMFLGLFVADGHLEKNGRGVSISQSEVHLETCDAIERVLTMCCFDWKMSRSSKPAPGSHHLTRTYRIPLGTIGGQLSRRGVSRLLPLLTKSVGGESFDAMTPDQFWAFLWGLWLGDGTKEWTRNHKRPRSYDVWNTDKTLLDDVQAMAVTRGFAANIVGPMDNGPLATKPIYRMRVRPRDCQITNVKNRPVFNFEEGWKPEEVWCITNATGTVIARRNGKAFVSGQCEVLTEGYDDPSTEAILFARPTQSQGLFIQCLGRGLRLWPGKTECLAIDCVGNSDRHQPVQLASLAGFDPNEAKGRGGEGGDGEEPEEEETPEVMDAKIRGHEVSLTGRASASRYKWRETSLGFVLHIPRIGYYLVAWSDTKRTRCTIRFFDQRPGRRDDPPRDVLTEPIGFEMAYGMVEAEMDRFFNARGGRHARSSSSEFKDKDEHVPAASFTDLNDGLTEDMFLEDTMLKDAKWREQPMSVKQGALLAKLGVKKKSLPETMGEASDLINILQVQKDAKMRVPATAKQLAYLRINGLNVPPNMTKGAAAKLIFRHRKGYIPGRDS